jgi:cytochrome d ubiquinol oxidase subunit I
LLTIGDLTQRKEIFSIRIPRILSLLTNNRMEGEVKGIFNLQDEYEALYGPGDYIPPVAVTYWSFRVMVGAGTALLALAFYAIFMDMFKKKAIPERILKLFTVALFLPYLANSAGWILAEVGRTPWTVFGVLKLSDSISTTVTPGMLLTSLIGYTLVYGALMVVDIKLLLRFAKAGPGDEVSSESADMEPSLTGG